MNAEQMALWAKHVEDYKQHRAEYLHLLRLDEDQVAEKPGRATQLRPHMVALRQLIAECDVVLAADAIIQAVAA